MVHRHLSRRTLLKAGLAVPVGGLAAPGHANYALRLDPSDNTPAFRADATFHRTAGLADGAWASFRSHNFPDRYIRHSGYVLRIDQLGTGSALAARQDATFQVTC
ncbi:AbfB domain-containing protein [Streptosporangium sp. NPDC023963]|uniref:AbfB domain-containing protein n=1 Tax=Streptosporangium sp. NPDC023963 TaxID=3155608 RepID=UPI00341A5D84